MERNATFKVRMGEVGVVFSVPLVSEVNCYSGKFASSQLRLNFVLYIANRFFQSAGEVFVK